MNQWKILRDEVIADDDAQLRAMPIGDRARGLFELLRPHIVCRRIDEIAREKHAVHDAANLIAIQVGGKFELGCFLLLLAITGEPIRAERVGERGKPGVMWRVGEAVGVRRQQISERAGP